MRPHDSGKTVEIKGITALRKRNKSENYLKMKKTLLVVIVTALFAAGATAVTLPESLIRPHGATQSLTFDDLGLGGGTANTGTYMAGDMFSFDVLLTFNGYTSTGLSFWLETVNAFAGSLSIIGSTTGTVFPDPTQTTPNPANFNTPTGASPGFMTETRDLGSTANDFGNLPGPGTYFVAHVTFQIGIGATPGTYVLQSTTFSPHGSEATSFDQTTGFADNDLPAAQYLITIVPEPTTLALIGLTAVGGAIIAHRRRVLRG
jgi:PEP-CTERM motif